MTSRVARTFMLIAIFTLVFSGKAEAESDLVVKLTKLGNQNQYAEILESVEKIAANERSSALRYFRFRALLRLDRVDEAKAEFEAAEKVAEKDAYDHLILAKWYRRGGDLRNMYQHLEQATKADDTIPDVKLLELRELRKYVDATRDPAALNYLAGLALRYRTGDPTVEREWIMNISGWPDVKRIESLQQFCADHPDDGMAHKYLGNLFVHQRNGAEALPPLEKAAKLLPKQGNVLVVRANAHTLLENFEQALADHNRAIELEPNAVSIQARGLFYAFRDKPDLAVADFLKAVELDSKEPHWRQDSLQALLAGKYYEHALRFLAKIAADHPEFTLWTHFEKSRVYRQKGDYEKAIASLNEGVEASTNDFLKRQFLVRRAYMHAEFDQLDVAAAEIEALKKTYPEDPGMLEVDAYIKKKRSPAAKPK